MDVNFINYKYSFFFIFKFKQNQVYICLRQTEEIKKSF